MSLRTFLLIGVIAVACSNSPDETVGPDSSVGAAGGTKSDAASGGSANVGAGGTVADAAFGGSGGGSTDAAQQPDQSCAGVDCGSCGNCVVNAGVAECQCPTGYQFTGGKCVLNPNPCDTTTCESGTACVPEAHCQPLGVCVQICDCSNCGNCGSDNSDGKWNDYQEYCGNPNASPATTSCTTPCPSGHGCLPYNPPICWPNEGCFSL